jgi:hypothetical protein
MAGMARISPGRGAKTFKAGMTFADLKEAMTET